MENFQKEKGSVDIILAVLLIVLLIAGITGVRMNVGGLEEDEERIVDLSEGAVQEEVATDTEETN